jgi:putative transposase
MESKRTRHSVYYISYHFVWTPKYRRPILVDRITDRLAELIRAIVGELGSEVIDLTVQPDHVRLFCTFTPTTAPY